jgi:hypothetical protein
MDKTKDQQKKAFSRAFNARIRRFVSNRLKNDQES